MEVEPEPIKHKRRQKGATEGGGLINYYRIEFDYRANYDEPPNYLLRLHRDLVQYFGLLQGEHGLLRKQGVRVGRGTLRFAFTGDEVPSPAELDWIVEYYAYVEAPRREGEPQATLSLEAFARHRAQTARRLELAKPGEVPRAATFDPLAGPEQRLFYMLRFLHEWEAMDLFELLGEEIERRALVYVPLDPNRDPRGLGEPMDQRCATCRRGEADRILAHHDALGFCCDACARDYCCATFDDNDETE
jgi:hypothetical protein